MLSLGLPASRTCAKARILIVDDDAATRSGVTALLRLEGFAPVAVATSESALAEARREMPDVVLTDLHMPGTHGLELCRRLQELAPDLPVIVMTGRSDMQSVVRSLRAGASDYLVKPLDIDVVRCCIERALVHAASQRMLKERLLRISIRERELADAAALGHAQQSALLEKLSEGAIIADAGGTLLMLNGAAREMLGVGDAVLTTVDALVAVEARDVAGRLLLREERPIVRALRGEDFKDYEVIRGQPDGERRHIITTGTSVRDAGGRVAQAIVVFRDVTLLRRLERQRDEYLALISHDLRTPLSVVRMGVAALKEAVEQKGRGRVPPAIQADLAARVERNAKRLTVMLDELREATSLEAQGGVPLERVSSDLRAVVANVIDSVRDERSRVTIEGDDGATFAIRADPAQLERVIANLVTNALKYSADDSPVTLRFARGADMVELAVADRGIGIAPEALPNLFDRYYRTPGGKARAGGLGLGLYIASMIVAAHGGRLCVASELGKGSVFTLSLPADRGLSS